MKAKILLSAMVLLPSFTTITAGSLPVKQELNMNWKFKQARGYNWYPATVPGVVHTDLLDNKLIDDPFFRLNERELQWIDKEDWLYETNFNADASVLQKNNIRLKFDGLDTYADVTLNGRKILVADNMFREWEVSVKGLLKEKDNVLQVYFHSPIKVAMPLWEAVPFQYNSSNDQSENGGLLNRKVGVFTRKAGYHYGWDWGPRLVTSGIWRPVYLEAWDNARINDVHYTQTSVSQQEATVNVMVEVLADRNMSTSLSILNRTDNKLQVRKTVQLSQGMNKIPLSFKMEKPRLWWTNGLGEQFLYNFLTVLDQEHTVLDTHEQKLGIRSVKIITKPDKYGESFYVELNGRPVFAKGANYIPCDNFLTRVTDSIYERTILDAVNANMNMLRVWGGGIYENNVFYDLCDKYGILIWQDFMFACALYPSEGELLENIRQEAIDNVRRLRNHTCIALWCGNNECLDAWFNWNWKYQYDKKNPVWSEVIWKQFTDLYFEVLPAVVAEYQPGICYRKSSPYSDDRGTRNHTVGDMHYWEVWQGKKPLSQFMSEKSRFFSEYGFQSFPEFESVKRYAPEEADWNVTSEVMMSHQRGGINANNRINDFLLEEYKKPKDFQSFIYMSQLLQADAIKMAMETHRRNMPYCMGSLVWQHNDCWPVASWSSRDYYGRWKAQHYFTSKSFADILISPVEEEGIIKLYSISDRLKKTSGILSVQVIDLDKGSVSELEHKITIPANSSTLCWQEDIDELLKGFSRKDIVIHLEYKDKDGTVYENNLFPAKHKEIHFPQVAIDRQITAVNGGYAVTLTADKFARAVFISLEGKDDFITDNYIDLLPGKAVTIKVLTNLLPAAFEKRLKVISFVDTFIPHATLPPAESSWPDKPDTKCLL